uniref:Novel immune-type receptor 13 n=1 Tax=Salmo trutta TaxID=8032 RepID=A0A673W8C7_SALTR
MSGLQKKWVTGWNILQEVLNTMSQPMRYVFNPVITVQLGDPVTLLCVFPEEEFSDEQMYWYKQTVGGIPQLVSTMHKYLTEPVFHSGFNNSHFNVKLDQIMFCLTIMNMIPEDEAMYYCAIGRDMTVEFRGGTFLSLKGKIILIYIYKLLDQQPESDPVHPGDSYFNCTVLSETCTGEHSVYWFRAGSGESHPGVIYTHGNMSDECEKSPETPSPTQSCVYSLSKNNLSLSDAGTYYCAVATCGEILFGNGTNLKIERSLDHVVIGLGVTSVFCVIVIIILDKDGVTLNYAALHFSERKTKRGRKKRETPQESVYSDVRHSDWE